MRDRPWLPCIGLGIILAVLGNALQPTLRQASVLMLVGGALLLIGLAWATKDHFKRPRDPYSLEDLRRVHEEEQLRQASWEPTDDADEIVCVHCGTIRPASRPKCPTCGSL
jgi:hypothetical protein